MKTPNDYYSPEDRKAYNRSYFQNNKEKLTAMNRTRLKLFQRRRRMFNKILAQVESNLKKNYANCNEKLTEILVTQK